MSRNGRTYTLSFKLMALARMEGCRHVTRLAAELGVSREVLYLWHRKYAAGGEAALGPVGRPRRSAVAAVPTGSSLDEAVRDDASQRIAELERKIGQQQRELDFFRAALRHVRDRRRGTGGSGGTASTR